MTYNIPHCKKGGSVSHQIQCDKAVSTVPPYLEGKSHQLLKVGNSHHLFTPLFHTKYCHTDVSFDAAIHNRKSQSTMVVKENNTKNKHIFAWATRKGFNMMWSNLVLQAGALLKLAP